MKFFKKFNKLNYMNAIPDELKDAGRQRLDSPVLGNFILAWIVCNWKIFFVAFFVSEDIVGNKLNYIIENVLGKYTCLILPVFVYPFLFTCFMVFAYPWITSFISSQTLKSKLWLNIANEKIGAQFKTLSNQNESQKKLLDMCLVELKKRVVNDKNELIKSFAGDWRIEMFKSGNIYDYCSITDNYFLDNSRNKVLILGEIHVPDHSHANNLNIEMAVDIPGSGSFVYNVLFKSRDVIELNPKSPRDGIIKLTWQSVN